MSTLAVSYTAVRDLHGPLVVMSGVSGVGWDEFAEVRLGGGEIRHGRVLAVEDDLVAVIQVLEGTSGMDPDATAVTFAGRPLQIEVGPAWLGRTCNGRGEPIDDGPPVTGPRSAAASGAPLNPTWREPPVDPVLTGVSAIDALTGADQVRHRMGDIAGRHGRRCPMRAAGTAGRGAALLQAERAARDAVVAAARHAAAVRVAAIVSNEADLTRRRLRALEHHRIPALREELALARVEDMESADAVLRRWAAEQPRR